MVGLGATESPYVVQDFSIHNSSADRARELFKPSEDMERILVSIKKIGKFWI